MKVASLFSGGKDSTYALYVAQQRGWDVSDLLTLFPKDVESRLCHVPNLHLASLLSECLGIPITRQAAEKGEDGEIAALKAALGLLEVDGVVTGAVASEYQKSRIDGVCHDLDLKSFSPLWRRDQAGLLEDYLSAGFRIKIVGVAAEGLDASWLGRDLDAKSRDELLFLHVKHGLSPCGEGGEYESLAVDGPNFRKRLQIDESETRWQGNSGTLNVLKASVVEKP